jgi:NAD+ kinase
MNKVIIIPNIKKDIGFTVTRKIIELVSEFAEVYCEEKYSDELSGVNFYENLPSDADFIIVVGGDGSVLDASVAAVALDIPLIGVNLGKLGYLSEVEVQNIAELRNIFLGKYRIEEKMLLSVSILRENGEYTADRLALNDVTLSREAFVGVADFKLKNSLGDSVKYRADGIIISTPAGSTAYSLSAGGPIVSHDIDSILATPICPHSFFNRAIVFNSSEIITLKNLGEEALNINIDGRRFDSLGCCEVCTGKASDKKLKIITLGENNIFSTLFRKMKLLEDVT